ncbi:RNA-directed DNA polymerase, eukaryota [Tanacetum coccineum]
MMVVTTVLADDGWWRLGKTMMVRVGSGWVGWVWLMVVVVDEVGCLWRWWLGLVFGSGGGGQSCTKFETSVKFSIEINGVISYGEIRNLTGVVTKDLFLWFPVQGIYVDVPSSGVIYFDVGVVWKRFAVSLFEYPRECVEGEGEGEMVMERASGREVAAPGSPERRSLANTGRGVSATVVQPVISLMESKN